MLRSSFAMLVLLAGCADLKTAQPSANGEEAPPPATETTIEPTAPEETTKKPATTTDGGASSASTKGAQGQNGAGDADDGAPPLIEPAQAAAVVCNAFAENRVRCDTGPSTFEQYKAMCMGGNDRQAPNFSAKYVQHVVECFAAPACTESPAACWEAWSELEPAPASVPVVEACLARQHVCPASFRESDCYGLIPYNDRIRTVAGRCFADPACDSIPTCLHSAMTQRSL